MHSHIFIFVHMNIVISLLQWTKTLIQTPIKKLTRASFIVIISSIVLSKQIITSNSYGNTLTTSTKEMFIEEKFRHDHNEFSGTKQTIFSSSKILIMKNLWTRWMMGIHWVLRSCSWFRSTSSSPRCLDRKAITLFASRMSILWKHIQLEKHVAKDTYASSPSDCPVSSGCGQL